MAQVIAGSQANVLLSAVSHEALSHGSQVVANLSMVRADGTEYGEGGDVYFCNIPGVTVIQVIAKGDGLPLPRSILMPSIMFPGDGFFNLNGILLTANGNLTLALLPETVIEPIMGPPSSWSWGPYRSLEEILAALAESLR